MSLGPKLILHRNIDASSSYGQSLIRMRVTSLSFFFIPSCSKLHSVQMQLLSRSPLCKHLQLSQRSIIGAAVTVQWFKDTYEVLLSLKSRHPP